MISEEVTNKVWKNYEKVVTKIWTRTCCEQVVKKSRTFFSSEIVNMLWTVVNKSWSCFEKVVNKSRTSNEKGAKNCEKDVNKSWISHKQVENNSYEHYSSYEHHSSYENLSSYEYLSSYEHLNSCEHLSSYNILVHM